MNYTPEETPALWLFYRADVAGIEWIAGEQVQVGTVRMYGGTEYICLQAHVTQADWTPPSTPALWAVVVPEPEPTAAWGYPIAYVIGIEVTYNGRLYSCRQSHTSQAGWTPPVVPALWLDLGVYP